jgi:hypothetical protein
MEALGRNTGSESLRSVALGVSQLGHGDGKLGELRYEHHHCVLVLVTCRGNKRKQPSGHPQPVPGRCGPGDATVATPSCAGVAVCRLPERPAAQNVGDDMQGVGGSPGCVSSRCRIGEGARPDRVSGPRGRITCAVPDVTAFLGAQPDARTGV